MSAFSAADAVSYYSIWVFHPTPAFGPSPTLPIRQSTFVAMNGSPHRGEHRRAHRPGGCHRTLSANFKLALHDLIEVKMKWEELRSGPGDADLQRMVLIVRGNAFARSFRLLARGQGVRGPRELTRLRGCQIGATAPFSRASLARTSSSVAVL